MALLSFDALVQPLGTTEPLAWPPHGYVLARGSQPLAKSPVACAALCGTTEPPRLSLSQSLSQSLSASRQESCRLCGIVRHD